METQNFTTEEYRLFLKLRNASEDRKEKQKVHNKRCLDKFYNCTVCSKEMKYKSKHNHIKTKEHLKAVEEFASNSTEEEAYKLPDPTGLDYGLDP